MKQEKISDALDLLPEELLEKANGDRIKKKRRAVRPLLIAAIITMLLTATAYAEIDSGAVSNLLSPLFGGVQAELVNNIGKPVGASVSADGYTLTADAVIGDRYSVAVVYTFTREDGQPMPKNLSFEGKDTDLLNTSGSRVLEIIRNEETPHQVQLIEVTKRSIGGLIGRVTEISFSGLSGIENGETESTLLAQGPWNLKFPLRYRDDTSKLPVKNLKVTDAQGGEYVIEEILLSSVGLHMEVIAPAPEWEEAGSVMMYFDAHLALKDGSTIALEANKGGGYSKGDTTVDAHYSAMFPVPIPKDQVAAIVICGTEVPVELP